MQIITKTKIGETVYEFHIDEKDEMEALHRAAILGNPPSYCTDCKNDRHFRLDSNKDKESNIYVNIVCKKCGSKAKLGRYKSSGYFWHKFEKYIKAGQPQAEQVQINNEPEDNEPSGLPF